VYLIQSDTAQYILKVSHHHWRSGEDIGFELELLDFLRQSGLPVAYPLTTKDQGLSVEIDAPEGKRYAALFNYAPGKIPLGDFSVKQSHNLGKTLAKIHQAGLNFKTNYQRQNLNLEYLLDRSLAAIAPFLECRNGDLHYLLDESLKIKERLQNLPQSIPFWTICWGDPHSGNTHFLSEERFTIFDFDQCGYGWRAFDLAKFLHISLRAGISKQVREAFVDGYQTIQELSAIEQSCLQPLTQTAHIWSWAISLNSALLNDYSQLDCRYFTVRLEQLKRLASRDWQLF
jgi:Ser/Thr protein kinase RdoA (MazF antagonist)